MAQASCNVALIEDLVTEISKLTPSSNAKEYRKWKDYAVKTAKSNNFGRVNQFEVEKSLNGMIEKFQVLNREDLAIGLDQKLKQLEALELKWQPDILFLLLELSNRPVKFAKSYTALPKPTSSEAQALSWEEILNDDPYSDDELWKDASYSSFSSDGEEGNDEIELNKTPKTRDNVPESEEEPNDFRPLFMPVNKRLLEELKNSQIGVLLDESKQEIIPEILMIRELLLTIRGLPSTVYRVSNAGKVEFLRQHCIANIAPTTFSSLMQSVATIASELNYLRSWVQKSPSDILLQAFQSSIQQTLHLLDRTIGYWESRFSSPQKDLVVSLIATLDELQSICRPVLFLSGMIKSLISLRGTNFAHLELLYNSICEQQASGDDQLYEVLVKVFFESLDAYLKPIRQWMIEGSINARQSSFFIEETTEESDNTSIWHDQFRVRLNYRGQLLAPSFIHASSKTILNTGKSICFLRKLGLHIGHNGQSLSNSHIGLAISETTDNLLPFSIRFDQAFQKWIDTMYGPTSTILRDQLFGKYQLSTHLKALEEIYLSPDGSKLQAMCDPLLSSTNKRSLIGRDRYILSEKIKSIFAGSNFVNTNLLSVLGITSKSLSKGGRPIPQIHLAYQLPWPILNVIRKQTLPSYQKAMWLLMHMFQAKFWLRDESFNHQDTKTNTISTVLKQKFQWFLNTFHAHIALTVLQPSIARLHENISEAKDIDELTVAHDVFAENIQKRCLLSKNLNPLHQEVTLLLDLARRYHDCRRLQQGSRPGSSRNLIALNEKTKSRRRRRKKQAIDDDNTSSEELDDEHDTDDVYDADTETLTVEQGTPAEQMLKMKDDFDRSCALLVTGLRAVSRAGGEPSWEMLAEQLSWNKGATKSV